MILVQGLLLKRNNTPHRKSVDSFESTADLSLLTLFAVTYCYKHLNMTASSPVVATQARSGLRVL